MPDKSRDLAEAEPFKVLKSAEETGGGFVRFAATHYPAPGSAGTGEDLPFRRWANDTADEHVHPHQEERLKVLSGTYRVIIDGTEHVLSEGEEIVCPPNTVHRHFNPTAEPIRTLKEDRPARQSRGVGTMENDKRRLPEKSGCPSP